MLPTIGINDYYRKHSTFESGNSYTILSERELVLCVQDAWDNRIPGQGETGLSRKVVVPLASKIKYSKKQDDSGLCGRMAFYCPPRIPLVAGLPLKAEVKTRQDGEDPYVEVFVTAEDAIKFGFKDISASHCNVVCYSADALLENDGERSTDCDWEIITIICLNDDNQEPMVPLAMARNFLEKPGGTKGLYSAKEFAEAIYHHSGRGVRVRKS